MGVTALDTSVEHPWARKRRWSFDGAYTSRFWRVNVGSGFNGSTPAVCCISIFGQGGHADAAPRHEVDMALDGCRLEDGLRSSLSVLFGVILVSTSFVMTLVMRFLT